MFRLFKDANTRELFETKLIHHLILEWPYERGGVNGQEVPGAQSYSTEWKRLMGDFKLAGRWVSQLRPAGSAVTNASLTRQFATSEG